MKLFPRALGCLAWSIAHLCLLSAVQAKEPSPSPEVLRDALAEANAVINDPDGVKAAKNSGKVFEAAHALLRSGDRKLALTYFERGLQFSPWRLEEQLAYADLLMEQNRKKEALAIADMVEERSESDALCNQARKLAGKAPVALPTAPDAKLTTKPWICLVKLGPVNNVVLADNIRRLQETLGIPVFLYSDTAELGRPHRSAFGRWVKKDIMPKMNWQSAWGRNLLSTLGLQSPDQVKPSQLIEALTTDLRQSGRAEDAQGLDATAVFFRRHDQQWDAGALADYGFRAAEGCPNLAQAVVFGITEADLYGGDNNYLFGMALTGARKGVVSYARYRADFFGEEPPDRTRLVARMHKGLLSSVGFALNVPRPTDPTSARAYPSSLAEHDAKSEYMSEACIAGFEKALGTTLPEAAHKPSGKR